MSAAHPRIVMEIDPTIEPIGGRLSVDGAPRRPFSGWLALTRQIEDAVIAARQSSATGPPVNPMPSPEDSHPH